MAAVDEFKVVVQGAGGHGAMPQQTVDAIVTAAQIVNALQTVVLDGTQAPGYGIRGLVFTGGNSTLRGMFVRNFTSN